MRKIVLASLLFVASMAFAQNPGLVIVGTAPSGSCPKGVPGQMVNSTGQIWTCQSITGNTGTGSEETGGGGGGGCTGSTGQGVYFSGTNTCAGTSAFNFTAGSLLN